MKFTIAIPAYKATYLKECIESVLNQTYKNFELLVVNDDSPEDIDSIVSNYKCIKYYKNNYNIGSINVVDNWNKCLSYAQGDYFILLGDDDKMCNNYLEEFFDLIKKYPSCNVYHCRSIIINEESTPLLLTESRPEFEYVYDTILGRIKSNRLFFISDYVYKTDVLKRNGGFYKLPLAWASDDISSYIGALDHGIAHTNRPVFMYRRNSKNISNLGSVYLKMEAILKEEKWLTSFVNNVPVDNINVLLNNNIRQEIKRYIQKKKVTTICFSMNGNFFSFIKWFLLKKKYGLKFEELFYILILFIKEKRKASYE